MKPAGTVIAGLPVRFAGIVSAPLLPIAVSNPYCAIRSTPPTVVAIGPSAATATSGMVAHNRKSVWSNVLGYVPATKAGAELLFDVIATAYERSSVMVTTNLPLPVNWTEMLGSERLTGATLDRLTHRCKIIETKGESYRLQDATR